MDHQYEKSESKRSPLAAGCAVGMLSFIALFSVGFWYASNSFRDPWGLDAVYYALMALSISWFIGVLVAFWGYASRGIE